MLKRFLAIMISGVLFALPLGAVFYIFAKIIGTLKKLEAPLADKIGIQHFLGEFTLTALAIAALVLLCFALGLLLQRATLLRLMGDSVESVAVRVMPSLSFLKSMADEQFDMHAIDAWKGVLLENKDGQWQAAFLVEEASHWQTFFIPRAPKGDSGDILVVRKDSLQFHVVDLITVRTALRVFGQGFGKQLDQLHPEPATSGTN